MRHGLDLLDNSRIYSLSCSEQFYNYFPNSRPRLKCQSQAPILPSSWGGHVGELERAGCPVPLCGAGAGSHGWAQRHRSGRRGGQGPGRRCWAHGGGMGGSLRGEGPAREASGSLCSNRTSAKDGPQARTGLTPQPPALGSWLVMDRNSTIRMEGIDVFLEQHIIIMYYL